ncbi:hypothetical protein J2X69_001030 [Algoriphagus sp. 4150]|nr:hypothetical protein [Algoriphagus sp. 4150]
MTQIWNSLSIYLKDRIIRGKKIERLQLLIFFVLGVGIATWKCGLEASISTVFIFFSAIVLAQFISQPMYYLTNFQKKTAIEKGRVSFTLILLSFIIITQLALWNQTVFISSIGMGITYGIIIFILVKCDR